MTLSYADLQKLMLIINQGFQFLNTLSLNLENKIMLFTRHSSEIDNPVIVRNSIQVVNVPSIWQRLIVRLLPHKLVFKHISRFVGFRVIRFFYPYISACLSYSTSLPTRTIYSSKMLMMAGSTPYRFISRESLSAINTSWRVLWFRFFSHCNQVPFIKLLAFFRITPPCFYSSISLTNTFRAYRFLGSFRNKYCIAFHTYNLIYHMRYYTPSRLCMSNAYIGGQLA